MSTASGSRARLHHQPADRVRSYRHDSPHQRGGKIWINIFPDRPLTKKPAETRMGSGKVRRSGGREHQAGRVMFEMSYPNEEIAREACAARCTSSRASAGS